MARIRSVHPNTYTSASFSALSAELERTLTRLRGYLDDQGRGIDNVLLIKAAVYPLHEAMSHDVIDAELDELVILKMVIRWEHDGKKYICERPEAWDEQQRPQKPTASKCPTPPGYVSVDYRPTRDGETHSSGALNESACATHAPLPEDSSSGDGPLSPGRGRGDRKLEEEGEGADAPLAPPGFASQLVESWLGIPGHVLSDKNRAIGIVDQFIASGIDPAILKAAIAETPSLTIGALNVAIDKATKATPARSHKVDPAADLRAEIATLERLTDPDPDLIRSKRDRLALLEAS